MTEINFNFWRDHSPNYLEMAFDYGRRARLQNPDGCGKRTGECGDTVELFLCIENDRVQSVSFDTNGCMNTHACANTVSHLAEGESIDKVWEITPDNVIEFLQTLPEENYHCAELVVGALYRALVNYQELQRSPWKKPYLKD